MSVDLSPVPLGLLTRPNNPTAGLRRASQLVRWIDENIPGRPTFWDLHLERVSRGIEPEFQPAQPQRHRR